MKLKNRNLKKSKNRPGRKYVSLFTKSVVAFLLIGIIPLFAIGLAVDQAYADKLQVTLLMNLSQMTLNVGKNVTGIFDEMEQDTKYIYNYGVTPDYDYFYELMRDKSLPETKRASIINSVLRNIVYRNPYIDHVLFLTEDGKAYSSMRPPEIMLNVTALQEWHRKNYRPGEKSRYYPDSYDGLLLLLKQFGFFFFA